MSLGFGLLSAQRAPRDPRTWEDVYRETIDLAVLCEEHGYSSVWTTEHHFVDDGYMPSLLVTSAALAAATNTIDIATGVVLAPLHDPIRLAEDAATVQAISNGRLVLGLGLGWSDIEFALFGADKSKRGAAMTDILRLLPMAWTGEPFTFEGSVHSYPAMAIRPAPSERIPIIIGGTADAAVRRAARFADGLFSLAPPAKFAHQVRVGTEELERAGRDPASFRWINYAVMYPGPIDEIMESAWLQVWKYSDMEASTTRSGISTAPPLTDETRSMLEQRVLAGSPERILQRLGDIADAVDVPVEWVARSYFSDLTYERQTEIVRELASTVLPHTP